MIAMYNGMGGGAAATIAAVELLKATSDASANSTNIATELGSDVAILGILGAIIGTISFSGSIIAWAKLDGRLNRSKLLPAQHLVNALIAIATVGFAISIYFSSELTPVSYTHLTLPTICSV